MGAFYVGTSGYAFKDWKGTFYPAKHPDSEMLGYYSGQFRAVEINNTFYRMPREKNLLDWAAQVPESFRFTLKASQRITHHARLKDTGEMVGYIAHTSSVLGARLGATLFQLPPNFKKDLPRLQEFLATLPKRWRVAIAARHETWFEDDVYDTLRAADVALCITDEADLTTPLVPTASWGYVRLHRFDYDDDAYDHWASSLRDAPWKETFVFFKHDDSAGSGPTAARALLSRLGAAPTASS